MNSHLNEIWQLTLSELSKELNKPSFETWFNLTKPISAENNCLIIEVPNDFTKEWFETRYCNQIINALREITYEEYKVNFVIASDFEAPAVENENQLVQFESNQKTEPTGNQEQNKSLNDDQIKLMIII